MIKKNIKWESLIGIIIAISLLWFVILWIANLINYSTTVNYNYEITSSVDLIKDNTLNIVKKLDTSSIQENEIFYLYKDTSNKNFLTYTWVLNEQYKYIDKYWENIDPLSFSWTIYERTIQLEKKDTINWDNIFKIDVIKMKNNL